MTKKDEKKINKAEDKLEDRVQPKQFNSIEEMLQFFNPQNLSNEELEEQLMKSIEESKSKVHEELTVFGKTYKEIQESNRQFIEEQKKSAEPDPAFVDEVGEYEKQVRIIELENSKAQQKIEKDQTARMDQIKKIFGDE